ncbi:MAG TPA: zinc-ribbon domain-containing protein [Phycisphaerae bacterium]|nr:zinc-ribbon domain-containing protein [Phycisphaerae bacterium]
MGSATLTVFVIVGVLVVLGAVILCAGSCRRKPRRTCRVKDCGHPNPPDARFCAQCGHRLNGNDTGYRNEE